MIKTILNYIDLWALKRCKLGRFKLFYIILNIDNFVEYIIEDHKC